MTGQELLSFIKQLPKADKIDNLLIYWLWENAVLDEKGKTVDYIYADDCEYWYDGSLNDFEKHIKDYPDLDYEWCFFLQNEKKVIIVCIQEYTADSYIYEEDLEEYEYYCNYKEIIEDIFKNEVIS